ncbi:MAG: hypothetical protein WCR42_03310 [bacterium]
MISKLKIILFLVFVPLVNLNSQIVECPQDYDPLQWGYPPLRARYCDHVQPPSSLCYVDYFKKIINDNRTEIIIDWSSYYGTEPYNNLTTDEIKDFLYISIVQNSANQSAPWVGIKQFVIIEKSQCAGGRFCYFQTNQSADIVCGNTECWSQAEIDALKYTYNNINYWRIGKVVNCGIKCCERIVSVEIINDRRVITGMTLDEYPGTSCDPGVNGSHCKDINNTLECSGGCGFGWTIRE